MARWFKPAGLVLVALLRVDPCSATPASSAAVPWWSHAVIYEIYVRSFQDSNGDGVGDLNGVTQRLDYLKSLGVDAIWLTPFYPSPNADFGYDVADYKNVAPEYGTLADWDRLVREADQRGIRILVDLVLNHSSEEHPWFKESRASRLNPKRDWYVWRDGKSAGQPPTNWESIFGGSTWTFDTATQQWYYHVFLSQQPDLNWASSGLREAMADVVRFWLKRGAAGFRLDATPYLFEDPAWADDPDPKAGAPPWLKAYNSGRPENHQVLRDLRSLVDGFPGQRLLLGESATGSIGELAAVYGTRHDEINLPMDFLFGNMTRLDAGEFKRQVDDAETKLDGQPPVFFFSSHDHARQWSTFGDGVHNDAIAKLTAALVLTQRGTALLYYGEEIGMGDMPPDALRDLPLGPQRPRTDERDKARTPMQWSAAPSAGFSTATPWLPVEPTAAQYNVAREAGNPESIYRWYAQLLRLRHDVPALRDGLYVALESGNPQVFAFARSTADGQGVVVVLNASGTPQPVRLGGWPGASPRWLEVLLSSPTAMLPDAGDFSLAPFGVLIAKVETPPASSRPEYHFTPTRNWMNDPNGLVFADGQYHLFYQYNPAGARWGHMSWGHAQSTDLLSWREMPVAIAEDARYMIFSGSVVVDRDNSSGLGMGGAAPLVALYTGQTRDEPDIQNQQLAFSNDHGETWTKFDGNPVLDLGLREFRDPKVFWYAPTRQWIMATVLSDRHQVTFHASTDLKTWSHVGDFGPLGAVDGAWECPDLFPLAVSNAPGEVRWVLKVDVFKGGEGSGAQYFVGHFDGRTFTAEPGSRAHPIDYGRDFYAAASWSDLPSSPGRHVWIAWMNNHAYAQDTPTSPWRGMMSVPREVTLRRTAEGYRLVQLPVAELSSWRSHPRHFGPIALHDGPARPVAGSIDAAAEIIATLQPGGAAEMGLEVRVGPHEKTVIGYDVKSQQLFIDRAKSGQVAFNRSFVSRQTAPVPLNGGLTLRILLDSASIEVFADDGGRVLSEQIFPTASSRGLRAYARGGGATLDSLDVWRLKAPVGGADNYTAIR